MVDKKVTVVLTAKDRASRVFKEVGGALKTSVVVGAAAAAAGLAALTAVLVKGTIAAIDFQKGVAEIKALGVEKSIKEISKEVDFLTRQFGGKPQATIKAYYDAISAGVKESRVVEFLSEASKLALAGATDVSIATDILTGLRATFEETDRSLAATVKSTVNFGKTTVQELQKIGTVAPIAAKLNIDFQSLAASVAEATIVIGRTDETLTGLKAAFSAVLKPSSEAQEVAKRLKLDFSAAAVQTKGWVGFLADLAEKTKGNSTDMVTLFGSVEAFNVVSILAKNNAQGLADTFAGIRREVETGAFEEAAEAMKDTAAVRLDILRAELNSVVNTLTLEFLPAIVDVSKGLVDIIKLATGDVLKQEFAPGVEEAGARVRQLEGEINELSDSFGANIAQQTGTQQKLERLKNELAKANLEFRQAALGSTEFDDRLVALANELIATGTPAVSAYDSALRKLRIRLIAEKEGVDAAAEAERDAAEARVTAAEAVRIQAEEEEKRRAALAMAPLVEFPEPPPLGELFGPLEAGIEALARAREEVMATNAEFAELGAAIAQASDPEVLGVLGRSLVESIKQIDPEITSEAIVEKLRETFPEIDFEALAEETPFFAELLREANPEGVGAAVGEALEAARGPIQSFTGGLTQLQGTLSALGVEGAGGFGKFAKATAKVQAVISTAQALFEIAQSIAAFARLDFKAGAEHSLAAAKFTISAQGAESAQGAISLQEGGFVPMLPGASPDRDSILAALTPGELVIPRPFAEEVRRAQGLQDGGIVGGGELEAPMAGGAALNAVFIVPMRETAEMLMEEITDVVRRHGGQLAASELAT